MNYFPWHIGDYSAHTGHLEPMEDLIYRRLLDAYYLREGPLPADVAATAKLIRLRSVMADVESVLREFFDLTADGWNHGRCDEEIAKMRDKQTKARASGKASAEARRASVERSLDSIERSLGSESTDVQLPTPTPTPTPTPKIEEIPSRLSPATAPALPDAAGIDLLGHQLNGHAPKTVPDCPHLEVLALWAEVMPELPQHDPALWHENARSDNLRARWRSTASLKGWASKEDGLAYFRRLFVWCRQSKFLMGQAQTRDRRAFRFELAWLVNPTNWTKVHEGKFNE